MRRRILFVTTSTALGGAEKTLYLLATRLKKPAFEVAGVISLKMPGPYGERLRAAGVRVETLDLGRFPKPWDAVRLARHIEALRPDIVHAFLYSAIELSRLARRLSAHPHRLVSSPRANVRFRGPAARAFDRLLKGSDDLLVSECEASRRYLLDSMGYDPERVVTVLNGVETRDFSPDSKTREAVRESLGLSGREVLVGTVGRVAGQKGQEHLIAAVESLLPAHPELRLAVVGEGPLRPVLGARLMRKGLSDRLWLVGEKPDVRPWLAAFDIFVLPSLFEGLPNALLEAMACGLPVVATAVDGSAEVVENGETGLLVPPGQPAALAAAIRRLLEEPGLRERLAAAGRREVGKRFTLERMVRDYEAVYAGLRAGRS